MLNLPAANLRKFPSTVAKYFYLLTKLDERYSNRQGG